MPAMYWSQRITRNKTSSNSRGISRTCSTAED